MVQRFRRWRRNQASIVEYEIQKNSIGNCMARYYWSIIRKCGADNRMFWKNSPTGNFIIFTGALINHAPDGWTMNWKGNKKGEGIEYFVMLLSLLLVVIIRGSGPISIDAWILAILGTKTG